jgi:hypothetical protein
MTCILRRGRGNLSLPQFLKLTQQRDAPAAALLYLRQQKMLRWRIVIFHAAEGGTRRCIFEIPL